jgi:hypothetical protein
MGMIACIALVNVLVLAVPDRSMAQGPLLLLGLVLPLLLGVAGIVLFIAACRAYARMRGHSGAVGVAGALVGLAVWLGITTYLQWPTIDALLKGGPPPEWSKEPPVALWAGFAVGGLLLKALPDRSAAIPTAERTKEA